jgi:peroxiredoxin
VSAKSSTASVGSVAPDFTLEQVGGGSVMLSSLRGAPVVLVFLRGFA